MLVSIGLPSMHRRQTGAVAEMGEDDPATRRIGASQTRQFLHQIRIGQAVKAVAPHAQRFKAARDRHDLRHARQVMVESGVETRHLRHVGEAAMKRLGEQDFFRQMLGIERAEPPQFLDHGRGDDLRLAVVRPAMHHAMPDSRQRVAPAAFLDPVHQHADRRRVIRRGHSARKAVRRVRRIDEEGRVGQANSLDPAVQDAPQRAPRLEQREFDA